MVQLTSLPGGSETAPVRRLHPREWLDRDQCSLRAGALRVALAHGGSLDADSVTVVLAARAWCDEFPPGQWTAEIVRQLLWLDIGTWCAEFDVDVPDDIPLALWAVVTAARELGVLAPGSDDAATLASPLTDSGGFRPPHHQPNRLQAG